MALNIYQVVGGIRCLVGQSFLQIAELGETDQKFEERVERLANRFRTSGAGTEVLTRHACGSVRRMSFVDVMHESPIPEPSTAEAKRVRGRRSGTREK